MQYAYCRDCKSTWWPWHIASTLCRNLAGCHEQRAAGTLQCALNARGATEQDSHTMRGLACSALLAMAIMFAGSPALTTQVTMAEGMDSLGSRLISYLSRVVVCAAGSGSTTHDPLYSYTTHDSARLILQWTQAATRACHNSIRQVLL